jgi:5-methylcytosine-specific restriction endonuclease McrA
MSILFQKNDPDLVSQWRAIILFGQNTASYKFALAQTLLKFAKEQKQVLTFDDIGESFTRFILEHVQSGKKQTTASSSKFLNACQEFLDQKIDKNSLQNITVSQGLRYVLDAFHVVGKESVPEPFYSVDKTQKRLYISDSLLKISEEFQFQNLENEVAARWSLVETAWDLNMSANLLKIEHDVDKGQFFTTHKDMRRINVTSARDSLNGYQKGHCFYCYAPISIVGGSEQLAHVDHFFPHKNKLSHQIVGADVNAVWNLVLACSNCNHCKLANTPSQLYLNRLYTRNEFLIDSHHPLRETLLMQTGNAAEKRRSFLEFQDKISIQASIHRWATEEVCPPKF